MALAHARVTVTLEIKVDGTWGNDCLLDQIHKQASTEALNFLTRELKGAAKIIGKPKVEAIITEARP